MNTYRFPPSNVPGCYYPLHIATGTRVPGVVTADYTGGKRLFTWKRDKDVVQATCVDELSAKLDAYFQSQR